MATDMARRMVTEWGMSVKLGPLSYGEADQEVFLGHSIAQRKQMSDSTVETIDQEVRKIVDVAYDKARKILTENLTDLHTLAKGLLEYETLSGDEIKSVLAGESLQRPDLSKVSSKKSSVPTSPQKPTSRKKNLKPEPTPGL